MLKWFSSGLGLMMIILTGDVAAAGHPLSGSANRYGSAHLVRSALFTDYKAPESHVL